MIFRGVFLVAVKFSVLVFFSTPDPAWLFSCSVAMASTNPALGVSDADLATDDVSTLRLPPLPDKQVLVISFTIPAVLLLRRSWNWESYNFAVFSGSAAVVTSVTLSGGSGHSDVGLPCECGCLPWSGCQNPLCGLFGTNCCILSKARKPNINIMFCYPKDIVWGEDTFLLNIILWPYSLPADTRVLVDKRLKGAEM